MQSNTKFECPTSKSATIVEKCIPPTTSNQLKGWRTAYHEHWGFTYQKVANSHLKNSLSVRVNTRPTDNIQTASFEQVNKEHL